MRAFDLSSLARFFSLENTLNRFAYSLSFELERRGYGIVKHPEAEHFPEHWVIWPSEKDNCR
jgi:hypothetical protein